LSDFTIFGVSNSGKTSELIHLFRRLNQIKHPALFGLTAHYETPLEELAVKTSIMLCGSEKSVAATKSVVEQALFFEFLLSKWMSLPMPDLKQLADKFYKALSVKIENEWINKIVQADLIYFAGRNNGVAEELTLKTNEILRKRSDFLEGTYAIHGIEEVMLANDVMILIDPTPDEEPKFKKYLVDGVGITIIAISSRQTIFPTIIIDEYEDFNTYIQLAAGWNLLTECGLQLNIDLDKPQRARKIGNEFTTA
jgi:glutamine---fructose-6-phosphate transaminase (isomerizing)